MRNNEYYFLHIEGMDLAGKSIVSKRIKERSSLDWVIHNNRLVEKNEICDFINEIAKKDLYDDEIYGYLYYVALMGDLKKFEKKANIIQDSTLLLRSINYHREMGNGKLIQLFEDLVKIHPVPDKSIYLTASIDSRIERLAKRIKESPEKISKNDSLILIEPEKFIEMDNNLCSLSQKYFNSTVLDTTNLTEDEVADYIINLCQLDNIERNKQLIK